jgi:DNA-binding CsgD family transcriptional regulator
LQYYLSAKAYLPLQNVANGTKNVPNKGRCMAKKPIDRLTARHRDCLRLVASNHSTKEIALALNLSPNTVDGYISEAKEIIGAPTRRDAARAFRAFSSVLDPQSLGGEFSRVAPTAPLRSISPGDPELSLSDAASFAFGEPAPTGDGKHQIDSFHWFRGGREHNSLTTRQRLIWIATASAGAALIFLTALSSIDTLARLLSRPSL